MCFDRCNYLVLSGLIYRDSEQVAFGYAVQLVFNWILNLFFFVKIEYNLYFLDYFDILILKIIFKKWKNIINIYFSI
jgi:hypothetical protein